MTAADPFTRASQTWAPARATDARRTVAFEIAPRPAWSPKWLHIAVSGGLMWLAILGVIKLASMLVGAPQ